mgnify:CR=1 FL=1|tara:strand:+ start:440 stop:742 length:303 start_codon:yes stop_codon:yes gene_type:complete
MKIMVVDAQESTEPNTYMLDTDVAKPPKHMMRAIERSADKCFEHIMHDGAGAMGGLVNEDHDEADERALQIFEYFEEHCRDVNKYKPGMTADAYISIAQC